MPDNSKPSTISAQSSSSSQNEQKASALERTVEKINAADSILVALSDNPDVDQMTAAIALTMILDGIGKHATAIFSGKIPNAIEFLKPEETFERNTNSLQDFIVALNKEKADHIRYMIEGDFVKIYITPYRTTINQEDLEFSHGDYNVDLVIAFDVKNGEDLDDALSEYGRIMHDATAINISNKAPGRFAEIEWTNETASSVCEMVVALIDQLGAAELDSNIATALLTGVVAATDHFSNGRVTPESMSLAARLMSAGADQQLISANIIKQGTVKAKEEEAKEKEEKAPREPEVAKEATKETTKEAVGETAKEVAKANIKETAEDSQEEKESKLPQTQPDSAEEEVAPVVSVPESKNTPAQAQPEDDLIPTPANVDLPQPEPTNIPSVIVNPAAAAAPAIGSEPELSNLPQVDYTSMYPESNPVSPAPQPIPPSFQAPQAATPQSFQAPQPAISQAPQSTQPQTTAQYQPEPMQPISPTPPSYAAPSPASSLSTPAMPEMGPPQVANPIPAEQTPASEAMMQLEQLVQPTTPVDYSSMMAAELTEAANQPPATPTPAPVVTIQEPTLAPAPPLPMPDFNTLPPAPAPIIPDIIPPLAPVPLAPQPTAPSPVPTPTPSPIDTTVSPTSSESPNSTTPTSPAPAPQDNAAFQIPNYPLS